MIARDLALEEPTCVTVLLANGQGVPLEITTEAFDAGLAQLNSGQCGRFVTLDGQEHVIPIHSVVYINRRTKAQQETGKAAALAKAAADAMLVANRRR